jgi:hypothetical protein
MRNSKVLKLKNDIKEKTVMRSQHVDLQKATNWDSNTEDQVQEMFMCL